MVDDIRKRYGTKTIKKRQPLSQEIRKSIFSLVFGLVLITVVLSIVFLLNTSNSAQKGYIHSQLRLQNEELENTNKELKMKIIEAQSILNLENTEKMQSMSEPSSVIFTDPQ